MPLSTPPFGGLQSSPIAWGIASPERRSWRNLALLATVAMAISAVCSPAAANQVAIDFAIPVPVDESYVSQWLPYTEQGFRFEDVFGSTAGVSAQQYLDPEMNVITGSYLFLGDWGPTNPVTSQVRVSAVSGESFTLLHLDYEHYGDGQLSFLSSKGGSLLTPMSSSSGTLVFSNDPAWQGITSFTITGIDGAPNEWSTLDEAVIHNMTVAVPEPSTYAMALAGLVCGGWNVFRRRRQARRSSR